MSGGDTQSIDVLMPARGALPWIADALDSLARQSHPIARCLLIDDGIDKPEQVMRIARERLGERVVVLRNPGEGISAALNHAARSAASHWLARMDADDVAHPDRLRAQLDWLAGQTADTVACGTQVWQIDSAGRRLQQSDYPQTHEAICAQRLQRSCFAHPTIMVRRDALLQVPYRSALDGAEDVDLMLRLGERWRVGNLNQVLLDYRLHDGQAARGYRARQTALQELAFRLAESRIAADRDALDASPQLAAAFVQWRVACPGYADARQALTAARYVLTYLRGARFSGAAHFAGQVLSSRPWQRDTRRWIRRLAGAVPGDLRHDALPASLAALDVPRGTDS